MVAPIRDIGNKFFSSSVILSTTLNRTLLSNMDMDMDNHINFPNNVADNYNKVRGCSLTSSRQQSKIASMFSSMHLVDYTGRCTHINDFIEDEQTKNLINSSQLSYTSLKEQGNQVSKVADTSSNLRQ